MVFISECIIKKKGLTPAVNKSKKIMLLGSVIFLKGFDESLENESVFLISYIRLLKKKKSMFILIFFLILVYFHLVLNSLIVKSSKESC